MHISYRFIKAFLLLSAVCGTIVTEAQQDSSKATVIQKVAVKKSVPVSGIIRDAAGKPLTGISVSYKDFSATITGKDGSFTLKVPDYNVSIFVSSEGFQSKEIALKGRKTVSSVLYEETFSSVYDQAVLPTGNKARHQISSPIATVQTGGAWARTLETPDAYLQGKVAGLDVTRRSGTPNIGAEMLLRGYNSIYATNTPLIVVDGVIFDNTDYRNSIITNHYNNPLSYIDIKDIDNITVLKDGSSLYGTKGANGVILITTARAKELATRIDFSVYGGVNFEPETLPLMEAGEYRKYVSDILQSQPYSDAFIQSLPFMNDNVSSGEYYRYHNNTNWQKEVMGKSSMQNYYLKVTGGDNIAKYALTLGYLKNSGITKNTDLQRYNVRFNADLNLSKKLSAFANIGFTMADQRLKDQGLYNTNPLYVALMKSPLQRVHEVDATGAESPDLANYDIFGMSNPMAIINNSRGLNKNTRFFGAIGLNYTFTPSISLATTLGVTLEKVRETMFIPMHGVVPDSIYNAYTFNKSGTQSKRLFSLYNDTRLAYNKVFGNIHQVSARLGMRYLQSNNEQDYGLGYNSPTDDMKSVGNGSTVLRRIGGGLDEYRWFNTYFSADYGLRDKYFLNMNVGMDGSSRFGSKVPNALQLSGNSFAVLPSVGASWILSSEQFMAGVDFIDLLKLRANYGLSGNDDIGNYTANQYYVSQNFLGVQGLIRGNFGNDQLQWEAVQKINAGADVSLLKERLSLSVDVFQNKTDKMLIIEPFTAASGIGFAATNTGGMKTTGAEVSVQGRVISRNFLKWDLGLNIATNKSEVTKLPAGSFETNFGGATYRTAVGGAPNAFYGYKTNGVFTSDAEAAAANLTMVDANGIPHSFKGGDVRFTDMNSDHVIDVKDRVQIGNPNPDFFGSFFSHTEWKNWSLDAQFTFSQGNDIYNRVRNDLEAVSGYNNGTPALINRWRMDGDVTTMPKATFGDPMGNSRFSDRFVEDGSYLRLRTLSLSYNVPVKSSFMKYALVYFTGNNVFTLTKYLGYDPEFSAGSSMFGRGVDAMLEPQSRSVQAGVRVGL